MPLLNSIFRFARSRQGKRFSQATARYARSPQGRAKFDQVRRQITSRRKGGTRPR